MLACVRSFLPEVRTVRTCNEKRTHCCRLLFVAPHVHEGATLQKSLYRMRQPSSLFLLAFLLTRAGSLPLFSRATFSSRTTATEGAELGLGGPSAAEPLAEDTRGENHAKAPHCRDTKADCQHAKIKARAKKAAKLTAAEQAETKKQNHTTILPTFAGFSAAIVAKHKVTTLTLTLTLP